jgi:hypothetical protein
MFSRMRTEILQASASSQNKCLLGIMLGGNYDGYIWHRQRLKRLFESGEIEVTDTNSE